MYELWMILTIMISLINLRLLEMLFEYLDCVNLPSFFHPISNIIQLNNFLKRSSHPTARSQHEQALQSPHRLSTARTSAPVTPPPVHCTNKRSSHPTACSLHEQALQSSHHPLAVLHTRLLYLILKPQTSVTSISKKT